MNNKFSVSHDIVIVGGGVAGIHLATKLGRKARSRPEISIKLVDAALTHVWKPSLHEFAAGSRGMGDDEVSFLSHSVRNNYEFRLGYLAGVNTEEQAVILDPVTDDAGKPITPGRTLSYDTLFMVGQIRRRLEDQPLLEFKYRDRGSLVSIADQSAFGTLMGKALGIITFEGRLARWAYLSLYQMHLMSVLGVTKTIYLSIASFFAARTRPRLKLH